MSLAPGDRFGSFEIVGLIGVGGMGEVYRARDPQLEREVALKVLPETTRLDPEALRRLEREARLLASLNHPNIATLYGLEAAGDARGLVMELVEGVGLDERLAHARGRGLSIDDALGIARQIATALDAAHERGVVHRDLKPANVKIRPDGTVKVLDFGIAKALNDDVSGHPGLTVTSTPGAVVGTPAYMSPEQALGSGVDRRADIWAFGCVLYEMLCGHRAFGGDTTSQILARVLEREPDWSQLPPSVPPLVLLLLRQCLEKDVRKRRRDAGDVCLELESGVVEATPPLATTRSKALRIWILGAPAVAALAAAASTYVLAPAREAALPTREIRLQLVTPATLAPEQFALSPDARYIVFAASESLESTQQRLYLRALDSTEARPLTGTDGARYPFWSPDSRSIGFMAGDSLYRLDIDGGRPQPLASAPSGFGGAWAPDGTILFNPDTLTPLYGVPASGGTASPVTELEHQRNHRFPSFLSDGRHFLFYAQGDTEASGIYLGSLDGGTPKRLAATESRAVPLGADRVMLAQGGALVVRRLDVERGAFVGEPETLASATGDDGVIGFTASATGVLAYRTSNNRLGIAATWFDASGGVLRTDEYTNGPALSPDDRFLAYDATDKDGNRDVWLKDLRRGGVTRLTIDPAVDGYPVWSPDGEQLIFESQRSGNFDLWIAPVSRVAEERLLVGTPAQEIPLDWSVTGYVLYRHSNETYGASDLLATSVLDRDRPPIVVAASPFEERMGSFSPDGHWVAYDTQRSGRFEVVVQAFPESRGELSVSTDGGIAPLWSKDGGEIYFTAPGGQMMAARVTTAGSTFAVEKPVQLFAARVRPQQFNQEYAVTKDRRFLVNSHQVDANPTPITVVFSWLE